MSKTKCQKCKRTVYFNYLLSEIDKQFVLCFKCYEKEKQEAN